jgi:hypothetical protein
MHVTLLLSSGSVVDRVISCRIALHVGDHLCFVVQPLHDTTAHVMERPRLHATNTSADS